jgi:thioredoxin 1
MGAHVVTTSSFKTDVLEAETPVLVDFWAPWCPPCRQQLPIVEDLAKTTEGRFRVAKINIDENPEVASMLAIQSIPTLMVFKGGKLASRLVGLRDKATLMAALEQAEQA